MIGGFPGFPGFPVGAASPARYDIPEERIRELAIERAAARVRDVVEVIRLAVPGVQIELCGSLAVLAGHELDQATSQVRFEHVADGGLSTEASISHPFARAILGGRPLARVETPIPSSPHRFEPSPVKVDEQDAPRCASCGQAEDALIHHPDLVEVAPGDLPR